MWKNERGRDSLLQRRPKRKYANTALHYYELRVNVSCVKCTNYCIQPVFYNGSRVAYVDNVDGGTMERLETANCK